MRFKDFISSGTPGSVIAPPQVITMSGAALPGVMNFVDTSGGPITLTLPPDPIIGAIFIFNDYTSNFGVNNLIINGGTEKIMGLNEPMTVDNTHITFHLTYSGPDNGWRLT